MTMNLVLDNSYIFFIATRDGEPPHVADQIERKYSNNNNKKICYKEILLFYFILFFGPKKLSNLF